MHKQRFSMLVGFAAVVALLFSHGPGRTAATSQSPLSLLTSGVPVETGPAQPAEDAGRNHDNGWAPYLRLYGEFFATYQSPAASIPQISGTWGKDRVSLRLADTLTEKTVNLKDLANNATSAGYDLEFLVMLVPDPADSHLASSFDLAVAGLRMGLASKCYSFDRKWLPWTADGAPRGDVEPTSQDAAPGMLLFRREPLAAAQSCPPQHRKLLLAVFLVNETPAAGVHSQPLSRAISFITSIQPSSPSPIRILGPYYSTSAESLRIALSRQCVLPSAAFDIVSGSASAPNLERFFEPSSTGLKPGVIKFSRTIIPDDQVANRALRFFHEELGWDLRFAALLVQEGTPYDDFFMADSRGARDQNEVEQTATILFPSGLYSLHDTLRGGRSDPADKAGGGGKEGTSAEPGKTSSETRAADARAPLDDLSVFGQYTSEVKEAELAGLLQRISRYGYRYVGIVANDTRDELFLAEQIRRFMPDVIVFFVRGSLAYAHSYARPALFGTLAISSFGLVPRGARPGLRLDDRPTNNMTQFGSDTQEGIFKATQLLVTRDAQGRTFKVEQRLKVPKKASEPPIWIMANGYGAMLPIATLGGQPNQVYFSEKDQLLFFVFLLLLCALGRWAIRQSYLQEPCYPGNMRMFERFRERNSAWRRRLRCDLWYPVWFIYTRGSTRFLLSSGSTRFLLAAAEAVLCIAASALIAITLLPFWRPDFFSDEYHLNTRMAYVVALFAAYIWLLWGFIKAASFSGDPELIRVPWLSLVTAVSAVGLAALPWGLRHWLPVQPGWFCLRARSFGDGLSPLVPLAWLAAAGFLWLLVELKRQTLRERHAVPWPISARGEPALHGIERELEKIGRLLGGTLPWNWGWRLVVAIVPMALILLSRPAQPVAEPRAFGRVFVALVMLGFFLSVASFWRFAMTWYRLRRLLGRLEHCYFRRSFVDISREVNWNPMRSFVWYTPSFRSLVHSIEALERLDQDEALRARNSLENAFSFEAERRCYDEVAARNEVVHCLGRAEQRLSEWPASPAVCRFHAHRAVAYLRYVFNQLRYALMGAIAPALLLLLSVDSYAFVPRQLLLLVLWTAVMIASAVSLVIFAQMDRDVSLSEIGGTQPGQVTLNRAFLSNIFAYAVVPLVALISSQVPEIGRWMGELLEPLSRILAAG